MHQTGVRVILINGIILFYKGDIQLTEFILNFLTIDGLSGKIMIEHSVFGTNVYRCEKFKVINDNDRIGLHFMGNDIFIYKKYTKLSKVYNNMFVLADQLQQITVIVNEM